jgi:hypothetical protein
MLFASVPDAVKITSLGRQLTCFAITSLASSTDFLVERPCVCKLEGLPSTCICEEIALKAAGDIGVVAAWST